MSGKVRTHGPFVDRPAPSARWKLVEHWGVQLGDDREYSVTRRGDVVYLHLADQSNAPLTLEVARKLHAVLGEALAWEDDGGSERA